MQPNGQKPNQLYLFKINYNPKYLPSYLPSDWLSIDSNLIEQPELKSLEVILNLVLISGERIPISEVIINRDDSALNDLSTQGENSFMDEKEILSNFTFAFIDSKISRDCLFNNKFEIIIWPVNNPSVDLSRSNLFSL